jgi:chromosome segregation ATPase
MSQQMTEAMKSAKTISQEMTQWENRLESTKSEHESLKRQSALLQGEMDQKRLEFSVFISDRNKAIQDGFTKIAEERRVLESQQAEFAGILDAHNKEKAALVQEKSDFDKEKRTVLGIKNNVDGFIQAVRRAYTLIS